MALACVALIAGCGDDDATGGAAAGRPGAGGGGTVTYALPALPPTLDPLAADTRAEQVANRQVHEPLVASLRRPYDAPGTTVGLALSVEPSEDRTVWRVVLRPGVRFRDGSLFNAQAVLENARRWEVTPAGQELLPGLFAVDAPRPNEVRFIFGRPASGVGASLASPILGIVSPLALGSPTARRAGFDPEARGTGTGPFEVAGLSPHRIQLTRNSGWWGSAFGLGPALDAVSLVAVPGAPERLRLLRAGRVQIAEPLAPPAVGAVARDPLLRVRARPGVRIGLEASVRGIDSAAVPLLNEVWLTTIGN